MNKITKQELIDRCNTRHENKYKYPGITDNTTTRDKVEILCPDHGIFHQNIKYHYSGAICPQCGKYPVRDTESFIKHAELVHINKYDYEKVMYDNTGTAVIIGCPEHGYFPQTPHDHLSGKGCPICAGNVRLIESEVIKRSTVVHKGLYTYLEVDTNLKQVLAKCELHGEFRQNFHHHLKGHGCQVCAEINRRKKYFHEPTVLYYIKVQGLYKIGITKQSLEKRFSGEPSIEIINTWQFSTGKIAYLIEQECLRATQKDQYVGSAVLTAGNTELRIKDVIDVIKPLIETPFS